MLEQSCAVDVRHPNTVVPARVSGTCLELRKLNDTVSEKDCTNRSVGNRCRLFLRPFVK